VDNSERYVKRKKKHKFLSSKTNIRDNSDQAKNEIAHALCKNDLFQKLHERVSKLSGQVLPVKPTDRVT
jgi:hypothetical protein